MQGDGDASSSRRFFMSGERSGLRLPLKNGGGKSGGGGGMSRQHALWLPRFF